MPGFAARCQGGWSWKLRGAVAHDPNHSSFVERSVGDLNAQLDLSQSALSQHLAVLRTDGLVHTRREAQTILYSLADGPSQQIIATLHDVYCIDDRPLCGERP